MIDVEVAGAALKGLIVAQLTEAGVPLPKRVCLVPGDATAWDSEQLTINWLGLTRGDPQRPDQPLVGGDNSPWQTILFYEFRVLLARKVAVLTGRGSQGGIPSASRIEQDYQEMARDANALLGAMIEIHGRYLLVPSGIPLSYGPIAPLGPEGELSSVVMPVTFQAGFAANGRY